MTSQIKSLGSQMAHSLSKPGYSVQLFESISTAAAGWQLAMPADNVFLQPTFLSALEAAPPQGMQLRYLLFYENDTPIGVALCQVQYFKADQSINFEDSNKPPCFFSTFARYLRGLVASKVEFTTMACGNLLLTGQHGYHFNSPQLSGTAGVALLEEALNYTQSQLHKQGTTIAATLIKELFEQNRPQAKPLMERNYIEFTIQPNMVMQLEPDWKSFEDYMGAMTSKYRVRVKKAIKCGKNITKQELSVEDVRANLPLLFELYSNIASNSGFNVVNLNRNYLLELKERMPEQFKVMGYYYEDRLIAFFTTIQNGSELEAHFLGFEKERNRDLKVYLNILLDIVGQGIASESEKIVFARTALEIKSSIGAVAEEMYCYMRHRNSFSNRFIKPVLDYLRPTEPWEARNPFKAKA